MPKAAQAMPNMWASVKLTKMQTAMTMQGMMADLYPRARPKMMSVAAPVLQASATSCTTRGVVQAVLLATLTGLLSEQWLLLCHEFSARNKSIADGSSAASRPEFDADLCTVV